MINKAEGNNSQSMIIENRPALEHKQVAPQKFPKPIEAGGNGSCAIFSLLHQNLYSQGKNWDKISSSAWKEQAFELRKFISGYMVCHAAILSQDAGFCNDLMDDWRTVTKEELKNLLKTLNPSSLKELTDEIRGENEEDEKILLLSLLENWSLNASEYSEEDQGKFNSTVIKLYANYILQPNVQMDKSFWNAYTKFASDHDFLEKMGISDETFPLKQVLLLMKIDSAYLSAGFWPKEIGEDQINYSQCAYIYYNGHSHYQSFDRQQIVDYLTTSRENRPDDKGCTIC